MLLFHGTGTRFVSFDDTSIGTGGDPNSGLGHFFTDSPGNAADHAKDADDGTGDPHVAVCEVRIGNPDHSLSSSDVFFGEEEVPGYAGRPDVRAASMEAGYDGTYLEYADFTIHVAYASAQVTKLGDLSTDQAYALQELMEAERFPGEDRVRELVDQALTGHAPTP